MLDKVHARLKVDGPVHETWRLGYLVDVDAVEFCRTLAGRAPAVGLLTTIVPF